MVVTAVHSSSSPSFREALARTASGVTPARMLRELADAVERLTASRALILVLEDLHWMAGWRHLRQLVRVGRRQRHALQADVLAGERDDGAGLGEPGAAKLASDPRAEGGGIAGIDVGGMSNT